MKPNLEFLNKNRMRQGPYASDDSYGATGNFFYKAKGYDICLLSSGEGDGTGWEHVSVSKTDGKKYRMPTWEDMRFVKSLFWGDDETVVQFHPKKSDHVNFHPFCLHLWKKTGEEYDLPPMILVGPPS